MAEERVQPLVVVLIRDLGIDEVALVAAFKKQTRVQLIDPGEIQIDADALRSVPRDMCARLRVLPISLSTDGAAKVLRLAMADPTDTAAVAEIEQLTHCEIDVCVLPLSAIDELVDKGYRQINTAVVKRPSNPNSTMFVTARSGSVATAYADSEISVTAQVPLSSLLGPDNLEARLSALVEVLVGKGLITEAELAEALVRPKTPPTS
ncbi:MAG: ral secretory system protein domain protein [Deltaproteobacteria bacterium]|nr:ral secretory system protein domain protein [Deltaproteobacteria bacterium]